MVRCEVVKVVVVVVMKAVRSGLGIMMPQVAKREEGAGIISLLILKEDVRAIIHHQSELL